MKISINNIISKVYHKLEFLLPIEIFVGNGFVSNICH